MLSGSLTPGWNDIRNSTHLPYSIGSRKTLNPTRRVAAARHGIGLNLLYFDGRAGFKKGEQIGVEDWRTP